MLAGEPTRVADQLTFDVGFNLAALSTSEAGPIAYRTGPAGGDQRQFVWFDRSGKEIEKVGDPIGGSPFSPQLSPDGRRVAMHRQINGSVDVWLLELARGALSRFTLSPTIEIGPVWSPDGTRIVFASNRKGVMDLYAKPVTGTGGEDLVLSTNQFKVAHDWSPDGRFLIYGISDPKMGSNLSAISLGERDRKPFSVVETNFEEKDAQFSPDGKWIAFQSNESGRSEIYIQSFPGPAAKWPVSTGGGAQVRWRRDGKELFYIALDGRLMAVPVKLDSNAKTVEVGQPVPLFVTRVGGALQNLSAQQYMVSPDGQRFLMNTVVEEAASPITLILNWKPKP